MFPKKLNDTLRPHSKAHQTGLKDLSGGADQVRDVKRKVLDDISSFAKQNLVHSVKAKFGKPASVTDGRDDKKAGPEEADQIRDSFAGHKGHTPEEVKVEDDHHLLKPAVHLHENAALHPDDALPEHMGLLKDLSEEEILKLLGHR